MTSRDRVILSLNHQPVDRIPRGLWVAPEVGLQQADEVAELRFRYPPDITRPEFRYPRGERSRGSRREVGEYTDAWGCTWQIPTRGRLGELLQAPLADWSAWDHYRPPLEILERADLAGANQSCRASSQFVLFWSQARPLGRLQALRGTEAAFADLAHGTRQARDLLAMLHEFHCREMRLWASSDVDGVVLRDDWGTPSGLLLAPDLWRDWFKPLYGEYCEILHAQDKYVFFQGGGNLTDLWADLIDLGIDAIHAPLSCLDVEQLAAHYRGQVTFWAEVDQLPTCAPSTSEEVRSAVRRLQRALDYGRGGLIAQGSWEAATPFPNMAALFEQWLHPLPMHA